MSAERDEELKLLRDLQRAVINLEISGIDEESWTNHPAISYHEVQVDKDGYREFVKAMQTLDAWREAQGKE